MCDRGATTWRCRGGRAGRLRLIAMVRPAWCWPMRRTRRSPARPWPCPPWNGPTIRLARRSRRACRARIASAPTGAVAAQRYCPPRPTATPRGGVMAAPRSRSVGVRRGDGDHCSDRLEGAPGAGPTGFTHPLPAIVNRPVGPGRVRSVRRQASKQEFGSYGVDCWTARRAESAAPSAVGRWRDMLLGTSADASGSPGGGGRRCAFPPYGTVQQSTPYERRILTRRKRGGPRRATEKAAMRCARCRNRQPREAPKFLASPWPSAASSVLEAFTCLRCSQRPGRITGARRPPRATIGECRRVPGGGGDLATPPHHLCQRISAFSAGTKTPGCAGTTRTV